MELDFDKAEMAIIHSIAYKYAIQKGDGTPVYYEDIEETVEEISSFIKNVIAECNALSQQDVINNKINIDLQANEITFDEGTLIHCMKCPTFKTLKSIAQYGIISGDFIPGCEEEMETILCADFYRVNQKENNHKEIFQKIYDSDNCSNGGRGPFTMKGSHGSFRDYNLAFIINPHNKLKSLLDLDMYKSQNENNCLNHILEKLEHYTKEKNGEVAAIPYGIPSNFISGIVVGDILLTDERCVNVFRKLFPNAYLINKEGKVYFDPSLSKEDNEINKINFLDAIKKEIDIDREIENFRIDNFLNGAPKEIVELCNQREIYEKNYSNVKKTQSPTKITDKPNTKRQQGIIGRTLKPLEQGCLGKTILVEQIGQRTINAPITTKREVEKSEEQEIERNNDMSNNSR